MKSGYENGLTPDNGPPARRPHQQPVPASTEVTYELLGAYGFARRYAEGKTVADLGHQEEAGYGSHLLAQSAESVTALADLPPKLALPDGSFDVVVAFGVIEGLERPEELVEEAKRLLKEGGVLLVSVTDKRVALADGRGGMYVPEFRRLLEHHFGHVRLYRQGAVAGGLVFPASGEPSAAAVSAESVRLFSGGPRLGGGPPTTRSVMAVCAEAAEALGEERAYLLLDHDRGVFAEYEERAEDVELMLGEIRRMQETEVQAYLKTMSSQQLPLGALLRLVPQIFLYYAYYERADFEVADGRRSRVIARARHRLDTAVVVARYHRDTILTQARHHWDTTLAETGHRREATLDGSHHRWEATLDEIRHRRIVALEEASRRREMALEEASRRREMFLEEARRRRDVTLNEARHRRDLALTDIRHRRNLILAEIRHQRNVTLEHIIHRRNIIRGNVHALRQKDAKGLAKGVLRRSSALYRWLRAGQRR
jgi:SAM-dependent methyltransferase